MSGTYRAINYSIRPAKAVERKMLCEVFRRLYPFGKIETYRYVGFGSIYFSDFSLFHRALGMDDMLSIEKDEYARACFEFNRPYRCVRLDCRPASEVLPELDWARRTIAWLDYDGKLSQEILSDVATVCARACSGTMLVLSVNAQADFEPDEQGRQQYSQETGMAYDIDAYRLHLLQQRVGEAIPVEVSGRELRGKGVATVSRRIINATIAETLSARNASANAAEKVTYEQVINIAYRDDALMLTVGGVFCQAKDRETFEACSFKELPFLRVDDEPYVIRIPCLTLKEMRHISALLPRVRAEGTTIELPGVPPSHIADFEELYRYFPTFTEAVLT